MKKQIKLLLLVTLLFSSLLRAQVPQLVSYQGRIAVDSIGFNGSGQFKFALVNSNGSVTFWSNDGTSASGSEPVAAVTLNVTNGLYSVLLGDTVLGNMTSIPAGAFTSSDVRLRVWFNDGAHGSQLLNPDQRLAPATYLADGVVSTAAIAPGAVNGTSVAPGSLSGTNIAPGSLGFGLLNVPSAPGPGQVLGFDGNGLSWVAPGGGIWSLSGTSAYYNGGKVGIGTANPAASLEVSSLNGNTLLYATAPAPNLIFRDTSAANARSIIGGSAGGMRFYTENFWSGTNPAAYMALDPNGRLGISTVNPQSSLHIAGTADAVRLTGVKPFVTLEDTSTGFYSRIHSDGAGMNLETQGSITGSNPTGFLHLDGIGNVGIGTTTPNHHLSISGGPNWTTNAWKGAVELDNLAAIGWRTNSGGKRFGMGHTNGNFLMFRTGSDPGTTTSAATYDFAIGDNGYIGMGTVSPRSKLEIQTDGTSEALSLSDTTSSAKFGSFITSNGAFLGMDSNHPLYLYLNGQTLPIPVMTITTTPTDTIGSVGIGTSNPLTKLDVRTSTGNYGIMHSDGTIKVASYVGGSSSGATGGWIGTSSPHPLFLYVNGGQPALTVNMDSTVSVKVLTITGGADLAEPFSMSDELVEKGAVVVIDDQSPGQLKRSTRSYDRRVAGVVSGANGIRPGIALHQEGTMDGDQNVALTGRVYVEADASAGPIAPGDLLTTSDRPGHAMKVTDFERAKGAVLGKAMSSLKEGTGLVLVLVSLQ